MGERDRGRESWTFEFSAYLGPVSSAQVHPQHQTALPDGGAAVTLLGTNTRGKSSSKSLAPLGGFPGLGNAYFGALGRAEPGPLADFRPQILEGCYVVGNSDFF